MRKINYPKDLKAFKEEYKEKILNSKLIHKDGIEKVLKKIGLKYSLEEILVLPIEDLTKLPEVSKANLFKGLNDEQIKVKKEELRKTFNYTAFQKTVLSNFFIKHSKDLNIKTCCYCNIEFINAYINFSDDYMDFYHLINTSKKSDLLKIKGIGSKSANIIISKCKGKFNKYEDIDSLIDDTKIKNILKKLTDKSGTLKTDLIENKNHFTLDHILPQKIFPYLSLSLFNLTPSCYSCNSKLKKEFKIYTNLSEIKSVSPTGNNAFNMDFKIYFKKGFHKKNLPNNLNEYSIKIKSKHKEYIEKLNLQGRYNFHKNISLDLIDKRKIYSDSQLQEIVDLFQKKGRAISKIELKRQIFGSVIFEEDCNEQLEKYKKDIAKQLDII